MVLTEQEFTEAQARGEFGSALTYKRYLSLNRLHNKHSRNRARREQEEARNRATSLYDIKFKN